eukprot:TRINITY_DN25911_c0_g1_i2.p1 TRINITY_DN25911_c0_g1~~TRINITY_DN25911_c0_g1_i2.p1  ORF type:complete len:113 (+),score=33.37 TRINITY_DN25911_c0_g1_i2:176-514(+)
MCIRDRCHKMCKQEGVLAGGSAGLNVTCAVELANRATEPCTIVTVLCDSGVKYLSKVYNDEFLEANDITIKGTANSDSNSSVSSLSLIHISEPTRLLSISYAVFCLKKKKKK